MEVAATAAQAATGDRSVGGEWNGWRFASKLTRSLQFDGRIELANGRGVVLCERVYVSQMN